MKIFKLMMLALVAMVGLNSCSDDCNHDFIEHDFTQDIVGTWTFLNGEQAEAMVIKADGSFTTTGVMKGGSLYEEKGTIKVVNNKVTLAFDGDKETFEGRLEFVAGKSLSLVMFDDNDVRLTYDYCENDLADEIVGTWVCTQTGSLEQPTIIQTYKNDGKAYFTGFLVDINQYVSNAESTYKVIGNLLLQVIPDGMGEDAIKYVVRRLEYDPNGNSLGDLLTVTGAEVIDGKAMTYSTDFLRVKQNLNLTNKLYAYRSAYITNAKGADEEFSMLGHTFNMANIKASDFDVIFGSELYCVGLNANSIKHKFRPNGQDVEVETPITVEGNKVTLDMSAINPACRKVEMYMFQDADDSQLHIYMPTSSFVNYFANLGIPELITEGKLDPTDAAAVAKVYADMEARVESINVSFVFKAIEPVE